MDEPSSAGVAPITVQVLRGMEALLQGQRAMHAVLERSMALSEAQDREVLTEIRSGMEVMLSEQRALCDSVRLQTVAIEARTGLLRELGQGTLGWLERRWITLLIGVGGGLGLAGAKQIAAAILGQIPTP
jgi:hypothetical protein